MVGDSSSAYSVAWQPTYMSRVIRRTITEEIIRQRLSINVRSLRNSAALTLKKASERAEMHWRHWQKIEAGQVNITLQTLARIAEVLGIDPSDLLREPPQREPKPSDPKPSERSPVEPHQP
jgi:DNA-binding Xre family transcriptional regulator